MLTVILTGGQSRRMGRDKASLPVNGTEMSLALIERYGRELGNVAVSVDKPGRFAHGEAVELIDVFPGKGPINGLYSAFTRTDAELVFLTATDLPNGDPSLAAYLAKLSEGHDACVIRRASGHLEPMFSVYRGSCLPAVKEGLESERFKMTDVIYGVNTRFVDESELPVWNLDVILQNVNTAEDYERFIGNSLPINQDSNPCPSPLSAETGADGHYGTGKAVRQMNSIFTRRSIRRFKDTPVEDEKIERLLRAAMQAPSAKNSQPWEFMVITDAEDRAAVSKMSEYASMCVYAPVLIVTLANLENLPDGSVWWTQDMSAATQNILLQAAEEGLGAVWLGFYPYESRTSKMRAHYNLPDNIMPFSVVALGYSDRENVFIDRFLPERVHYGKW